MPSIHRYRTHTCGELRSSDTGTTVRLSGWLHNRRDLGGVEFLELRDHYGITQLVIRQDSEIKDLVTHLPKETVLLVDGKVLLRSADTVNPKLVTGEVEVEVTSCEVLGACQGLPFPVFPETETPEELRLRNRFLDLRRSKLHDNVVLRSRIISSLRQRMIEEGFCEFQTPILTSSSPEGARDYLVPSRVHPGKFYALPQAPQQFKQLLMVSGFDRYFQIAPCFRDEDSRADRSPGEFYQLDLEMSFATQDDVFDVVERVVGGTFNQFANGSSVSAPPFVRIPFEDSMLKFGCDKPDLRNPLQIRDVTDFFSNGYFKPFLGKTARVLTVHNMKDQSRSFFDKIEDRAKKEGAEGLGWLLVNEDLSLKGPIGKFIPADQVQHMLEICGAFAGSAMFFYAHSLKNKVCRILSSLRTFLGEQLDLIEKDCFKFCWIVDFPMFERDEDTGAIQFSHNPFSMPQGGLEALNSMDPLEIKAFQYDLVCNGVELSSGAIRNHIPEIMYRAFEIAGHGNEVVDSKFGGMINAFRHGAPPHGGIAPGVDRIVMLLANEPNIREVIAFPMNQRAQDLLMNAPSEASAAQLKELHIKLAIE